MDSFNMRLELLIADDDPDDLELYKEAISCSELPIFITTVETCDGILTALENGLPDIIIIDANMPKKSIEECVSSIRENPLLSKTPLIVLSTSSGQDSLKNYYKAGINLYLTKPHSIDETGEIFKRIFNIDWTDKPVLTEEEFYNR